MQGIHSLWKKKKHCTSSHTKPCINMCMFTVACSHSQTATHSNSYKLHSCPCTHSHRHTHVLHMLAPFNQHAHAAHPPDSPCLHIQLLPYPQAKYLLLFRYGPEWRDNISAFSLSPPSLSFSYTPILACGELLPAKAVSRPTLALYQKTASSLILMGTPRWHNGGAEAEGERKPGSTIWFTDVKLVRNDYGLSIYRPVGYRMFYCFVCFNVRTQESLEISTDTKCIILVNQIKYRLVNCSCRQWK